MKKLSCLLLSLYLISCGTHHNKKTLFSTETDTLVVHTTKQKGSTVFGQGAMPMMFLPDSTLAYDIVLPTGLDSIRRTEFVPDFKAGSSEHIPIITAYKNGKRIYIADANYNLDLTDDPVYPLEAFQWENPKHLAEINYILHNDQKTVKSVSWLNIGLHNGEVYAGRADQLVTNFSLGKDFFTITLAEPRNGSFTFGIAPQAAITRYNETTKATISEAETIALGEYLNLGRMHYRFSGITKDGHSVTLVKERYFDKKTGTQTGMLAPPFSAITTRGDTINTAYLKNKYVIIANSCGCGGDEASAKATEDIAASYGGKAIVLQMDTGTKKRTGKYVIDSELSYNTSLYSSYRKEYCSRMCYVIGPDNRIKEKFIVTDWEKHLSKIFAQ